MMPAPFIELEVQSLDKASFDRSLASMSKLAEGLIDQLTIIGLCCFRIRETLNTKEVNRNSDCAMIAEAVQEVTKLIDALTEIASTAKRPALNRKRFDHTADCEH
jgi:hypothetical protein